MSLMPETYEGKETEGTVIRIERSSFFDGDGFPHRSISERLSSSLLVVQRAGRVRICRLRNERRRNQEKDIWQADDCGGGTEEVRKDSSFTSIQEAA